jgi:hypothetical protein
VHGSKGSTKDGRAKEARGGGQVTSDGERGAVLLHEELDNMIKQLERKVGLCEREVRERSAGS